MADAPLIVVEGAPASLPAIVEQLQSAGFTVTSGFEGGGTGVVCAGSVATDVDASLAVAAALRGAGILIRVETADRALIDRLCDDLRHVGQLDHRVGETSTRGVAFSADDAQLLDALAAGASLRETATALHISRRAIDRRLAALRAAAGVATTVELLRGWTQRGGGDADR